MAIKNFGMKSIRSYLSESIYYIPDYQREYSWSESQLEDFWQDLTNAINANRHHFFGQVVIHDDNGKRYIIDGQQRTTTAVIMLAVFRDMFKNYEDENEEAQNCREDIRIKYIGRWTPKKDELQLHLGMSDRDFFKDYIQKGRPTTTGKTSSQKKLCKAYTFFEEKINDCLDNERNDPIKCVEILQQYYNTLINNFDLMVVETDDLSEAFIIFETLNARGKELETADLLKNYVFMKAGSHIDSVKDKWTNMLDTLEKKDEATRFIRYYWNATHAFTREKDLYKAISKTVDSSNCVDFVKALDNLADLYNALSSPENNKSFSDNEIATLLSNLSVMRASTFYPVIIAMQIKNYPETDVKRVLQSVEIFVFRNFLVGGLTANKYEPTFSKIAIDIYEKNPPISDIVKTIVAITNDDETFKRNLIGLEIKATTIAKYVLREIEDFGSSEKKTNRDNKAINLEHIMPKNISK